MAMEYSNKSHYPSKIILASALVLCLSLFASAAYAENSSYIGTFCEEPTYPYIICNQSCLVDTNCTGLIGNNDTRFWYYSSDGTGSCIYGKSCTGKNSWHCAYDLKICADSNASDGPLVPSGKGSINATGTAQCDRNDDCNCVGAKWSPNASCSSDTCVCIKQENATCSKDRCGAQCGSNGDCLAGQICNLSSCSCEVLPECTTSDNCNDNDSCTLDICQSTGKCSHNFTQGFSCNDGNNSTVNDTCMIVNTTGICKGIEEVNNSTSGNNTNQTGNNTNETGLRCLNNSDCANLDPCINYFCNASGVCEKSNYNVGASCNNSASNITKGSCQVKNDTCTCIGENTTHPKYNRTWSSEDLCSWNVTLPLGFADSLGCNFGYNTLWPANTSGSVSCVFNNTGFTDYTFYISVGGGVTGCTLNGANLSGSNLEQTGCYPDYPKKGFSLDIVPRTGINTIICDIKSNENLSHFDAYVAGYDEPKIVSAQSSGSGGGSGSTAPILPCNSTWDCTNWSICNGGFQSRFCTDINNCINPKDIPKSTQACVPDEIISSFCGDKKCLLARGENEETCPEDCVIATPEVPKEIVQDFCGDGFCQSYDGEDEYTCPEDCPSTAPKETPLATGIFTGNFLESYSTVVGGLLVLLMFGGLYQLGTKGKK